MAVASGRPRRVLPGNVGDVWQQGALCRCILPNEVSICHGNIHMRMPVGIHVRISGCIAGAGIWAGARSDAVNAIPKTGLARRISVTFELALPAGDTGGQRRGSTRVLWVELDMSLQHVTIGRGNQSTDVVFQ